MYRDLQSNLAVKMDKSICFYFQVHQPFRLRQYNVFEIGHNSDYFDNQKNIEVVKKVARKCYIPTNNILKYLIEKTGGQFKASFSISGTALDQFELYAPEVLESFKELAQTGSVEFLNETYHHTLSFLYSKEEFKEQVKLHQQKILSLFRQRPAVFRNTELVYNNELANFIESLGYKGILAEGADHILGWRSPNFVYKPKTANISLLLKNYKLSDDIAFRFSERSWNDYPLTAAKFASWVEKTDGHTVNLFMDYETFGEHQWASTGIFNFLKALPDETMKRGIGFVTPSELTKLKPIAELDIHNMISWADVERDLSAWLGNKMQQSAIKHLYQLEKEIKEKNDLELLESWRRLQTSDHFYYMCTKWFSDGDVHKYFNPYDSPYEGFITYMNVLNDLILRIKEKK